MNIFVVDKDSKKFLCNIDFIPNKDDRIILKNTEWSNKEYVVQCVVYEPNEHAVFIFVVEVEPYYFKMISEIKWR